MGSYAASASMHNDDEVDDSNAATWYRLETFLDAIPACVTGFLLLLLVFVAPDAGHHNGTSFFQVAKASDWRELGDWAAAWCSLKIVLLSLGVFFLLVFLVRLASWLKREFLALALALACVAPGVGLLVGVYFLVKAVL